MTDQTPAAATARHHFYLGDEDLGVFDEEKFTISDGLIVKNVTGLTIVQFMNGLRDADPIALRALVWFLRFKQGIRQDIKAVDFAVSTLREVDEPDPTRVPTGTTDASTSDTSPTTSATDQPTSTISADTTSPA